MTLLLNGSDVERAVSMEGAISLVEQAFVEFGQGHVDMPQRAVVSVSEHNGECFFMPAWLPRIGALSIKTVSSFEDNIHEGLPTISGLVTVLDPETGMAMAVMDGGYLTALRTGAASGVASKHLARQDSSSLAIFGAGIQARTQLEAMCIVRDITRVRVFDIDQEKAETLAMEMGGRGAIPANIEVVGSPGDAVAGADIVVTATTSRSPVFDGDDLSPGAHINGIGSHMPGMRELDTKTILKSKIVCDSVEACLIEAGDLIIPANEGALGKSDIHGEVADVITGMLPGRQSDEEITLFKSVGLAFQDAAVAMRAYQEAAKKGQSEEFHFRAHGQRAEESG